MDYYFNRNNNTYSKFEFCCFLNSRWVFVWILIKYLSGHTRSAEITIPTQGDLQFSSLLLYLTERGLPIILTDFKVYQSPEIHIATIRLIALIKLFMSLAQINNWIAPTLESSVLETVVPTIIFPMRTHSKYSNPCPMNTFDTEPSVGMIISRLSKKS